MLSLGAHYQLGTTQVSDRFLPVRFGPLNAGDTAKATGLFTFAAPGRMALTVRNACSPWPSVSENRPVRTLFPFHAVERHCITPSLRCQRFRSAASAIARGTRSAFADSGMRLPLPAGEASHRFSVPDPDRRYIKMHFLCFFMDLPSFICYSRTASFPFIRK